MQKLLKSLRWVDSNLLGGLFTIYLFLIPLYPKLPLMMITYTYVAIRLDDLFITIIAMVFVIQALRKKIILDRRLLTMFLLFWGVVFASYLYATFVSHTIVYRQVGFLHALRRVEYMFMFFVAMSLIRKTSDFTKYLFTAIASALLVVVYGVGQRVAEFPSVSTMNPEFAKGHILFLTPEARIASTFAGHYDLGTYLVFMIPIIWGVYFVFHDKLHDYILSFLGRTTKVAHSTSIIIEKLIGMFVSLARLRHGFLDPLSKLSSEFDFSQNTLWAIIVGAILSILLLVSSLKGLELFIGGTLIATLFIFLFVYKKQKSLSMLIILATALFVLIQTASRSSFIAYVVSMSLFFLLIKKYRYLVVVLLITLALSYHNKNLSERIGSTFQVRQFLVNEKTGEIFVLQKIKTTELPAGSRVLVKVNNKNSQTTVEEKQVKKEIINKATIEARIKNPKTAAATAADFKQVQGIAPDISFDTRLRVEWPRAIGAFVKNPLLGTGVSTITESTDNDYLRWLGETGILGFLAFMYILLTIARQVYEMAKSAENKLKPIFYGFLFGLLAVCINGLYIDVFEASKVAYTFWAIAGIYAGLYQLKRNTT